MEITNTYEAVKAIKTHLLGKHSFGFFNWVKKNENKILPNIKILESAVDRLIEEKEALPESRKRKVLNVLQKFLRELDGYYSQHTSEEELEKLGRILNVEEDKEISLEEVDKKLIEVAKWFTNNRIGVKIHRLAANVDGGFEVKGILGWGEYSVVLKVEKNNDLYALKISLNNEEVMNFKHPVFGKVKRTLKEEFEIMKDLWKEDLKAMPEPLVFYDKAPCFKGEKIGENAFLMEFLDGERIAPHKMDFNELRQIEEAVDKIHKAGYTISPDFMTNFIKTKEGIKIFDFAGFHEYKGREEDIKKYENDILEKLQENYAT